MVVMGMDVIEGGGGIRDGMREKRMNEIEELCECLDTWKEVREVMVKGDTMVVGLIGHGNIRVSIEEDEKCAMRMLRLSGDVENEADLPGE